jgi:hypothetical protein
VQGLLTRQDSPSFLASEVTYKLYYFLVLPTDFSILPCHVYALPCLFGRSLKNSIKSYGRSRTDLFFQGCLENKTLETESFVRLKRQVVMSM